MAERRFKNSWSRVQRAADHLTTFQNECKALFALFPRNPVVKDNQDSGWFVASLTADEATRTKIADTILPLLLGEFAYQLRAALDGLIWDAITFTQGTEPRADANRIEFPILNGKMRDFKKCAFLEFPFPDRLKTWLESIQPYSAESPPGHPDRGLSGALEDVHNLARLDRHRRLRIISALPTQLFGNIVFDPEGFKAIDVEGLDCNILGNQYDILRFKVESATGDRPRKIRILTRAKFEIFFEDLPNLQDVSPGERLDNLREAVSYVIRKFEDEFGPLEIHPSTTCS